MTVIEKKEYHKQWYLKNKEKIKVYYLNNKEKIIEKSKEYNLNNKEKNKQYRKEYDLKNKEKITEYYKEYYLNNKEKCLKHRKKYRLNNKNKLNEDAKKYNFNRKKSDPLFHLTTNIRSLISISVRLRGYSKKSRTYQILGCSFEEFKNHIEKQFTNGMTFENQGEWHLDHIYPVSKAKDEEHLIKLNHYTNFQPLWAEDNLKKGNKILC